MLRNSNRPDTIEIQRIELYADDGNIRPLDEIEADVIRLAFTFYGGHRTEIARHLRMGRATLYRKLHQLDMLP